MQGIANMNILDILRLARQTPKGYLRLKANQNRADGEWLCSNFRRKSFAYESGIFYLRMADLYDAMADALPGWLT